MDNAQAVTAAQSSLVFQHSALASTLPSPSRRSPLRARMEVSFCIRLHNRGKGVMAEQG